MEVTLDAKPQPDLELIAAGEDGNTYAVDADIVLKTACPYTAARGSQDPRAYAYTAIDQARLLRNERFVAKLLEHAPHPNLALPVATDFPEGIYLRRYTPLPCNRASMSRRLSWYADILSGLCHLHELRIAHYDLGPENVLLDSQQAAVLCDFGHAGEFGDANILYTVAPGELVPRNGTAGTLSQATDMFAAASLMMAMETREEPHIALDEHGGLVLPDVDTGNPGLDKVIRRAWRGAFASTRDMSCAVKELVPLLQQPEWQRSGLPRRVAEWRDARIAKYGKWLSSVMNSVDSVRLCCHWSFVRA